MLVVAVLACGSVLVGPAGAAATAGKSLQQLQWYLSKLGVRQAWQHTEGAGVLVGVADTGVDGTIPDLRGAVVGGHDFSGIGSANGEKPIPPMLSHGTEVASLIAGHGHGPGHRLGVLGTAPKAKILTASFAPGEGDDHSEDAIRWLADHGAKVINASFTTVNPALRSAVEYAESKDVVVVAGTGNTLTGQRHGLSLPAFLPGVVAVTGVDEDLRNDPGATIGTGTRIAAPFATKQSHPGSAQLVDGLPVATARSDPSGPYQNEFGTSLSTAIVSGIVALIRSRYPQLDAANVINRLIKTATPAGGNVPNNHYGYGVVNALKAVTAKVAPVTANPVGTLVPGGASSSSSRSAWSTAQSSAPETSGQSSPAPAAGSPAAASGSSGSSSAGIVIGVIAIIIVAAIALRVARRRTAAPLNRES